MRISVFILSLFLLRPSQASNNGKCEITDITDDEWEVFLQPSEKVYDDVNNKVIYQSPYTNKLTDLECICTSDSCKKEYDYIKIENNEAESKFIISTSDHMTDLDADTEKTQQSFIRVVYSCTMKCNTDQTSTLPIYIDIYDKNNHEPEFEEENYNYKVASPIMPVTDFTLYGDSIKAEDLDFSNTEMTFTIEPNDFDITTTVDYNNTKKYIANIRANKALTISSSRIYTLTATDGGTDPGPLNKTVKITIDVDETLSLDFPYFVYPDDNLAAYKFDYDSNENKLIPLTGNITLHTTRSEITDIHLIGEMEDSFEVKFDAASKTFEVSSPATIENPVSPSTALILSLKTDTEASTPIIIQFSNVPTGGVTFKDHSYTGSYDDVNNVVNMNENIELIMKTTKKPTFNITGDLSDNFGVDFDEDTKVCTIKVENKLTPEQISSKTYLTLIIQATVDTDTDKTVIVIQLPVHKLQFTNILYTATYNDDDTVDVDNENPIGFTTDVTDVKITVDEQYSQYFEITDKFAIEVRAPLPADILSSQTELALALTAEDVYGNQPQAVVKMILPLQDTMEAPKFSKPYYTVNYKENATVIDFTDPLSFDNVDDPSTVTITLSEYKKNFNVIFENKKWLIEVTKPLDSNTIDDNSELIITMEAEVKGITAKGVGVLVVLLEKSVGPKFSELSYLAKYEKDQTGSIDFQKPLTFENVEDPSEITITLDTYDEDFEVLYNATTEKWFIKVKKALDSDIFDKTSELVIKMTAREQDNSKTGAAVLIIELVDTDNEEEPKFSDLSYVVKYKKGQTEDIDFDPELSFTNVDNDEVEIDLDSYDEDFEVLYNATTEKWFIKVKKALDSDIFDTASELVIKMTARREQDNSKTGAAVLIIELVDPDNEEEPKFSDLSYVVKYKKGQTEDIDFDPELSFTNVDNDEVEIDLDSYDEDFEVLYNATTEKWFIKVKKALDSDIFDTASELVIKMTARREQDNSKTGAAVLIIELVDTDNEEEPKFSDLSYVVKYKKGQTEDIDFDPELSFTNVDNDEVEIDLDSYDEDFEVLYNATTEKWFIKVKKALDSDIFDKTSELVIKMTAREQDNSKTGAAVLIIELVDTDNEEEPKFSDLSYVVKYKKGQTEDIDFDPELSFTNVDNDEVEIDLDSYDEDFEVLYNATTEKWFIKVKKALDSDIFDKTSELVIKMTAREQDKSKTGAAVLIIELVDTDNEEEPKFSDLSYVVKYKKGQTEDIDFDPELSFTNVDNDEVEIDLDSYDEDFEVLYNATTEKWFIKVKKALDSDIFDKTSELVIKMTAREQDNSKTGAAVLIIELVDPDNEEEPKFSDLSYVVKYKKGQTEDIDFDPELSFTNVDNDEVEIDLDSYDEDFEVLYNATTEKWFIKVKKALDSDIFDTASELVIKMTARRVQDNSKTGAAVLVIELVDTDNEEEPKFSDLSYVVKYKKGQTEDVDFTNDVTFKTAEDNKNIKIVLDSYSENFEVYYDQTSNKWKIRVKTKLEDEIFTSNNELIFIMTATNTVNKKSGQTVLIMELIDETNENGIEFSESYYVAQYKQNQTGYVDFDKPISFKDEDMTKISINLDTYSEYFEVTYTSNKWCLHVVKPLDVKIFNDNQELILIMEAEQKETHKTGRSVLVIELIDNSIESKTPQFEEAYYTAVYPSDGKGTVPFDKDIIFDNVDDVNKVSISIQDYKDNFQIIYDNTSNKWFIDVIISLDDDILRSNTYLTSTLVANIDDDDDHTPVSAIVLKLPEHDSESAPTFSRSYFKAQYDIDGVEAKVTLEDDIEFSNDVDNNNIEIVADDYSEFLTFEYDTKTKLWQVKALSILDTATLNKSELVVAITATDSDTKLQGRSVIDLKLPKVNTDDAPRFSKTYYKANYDMSTDTATVNLEDPIDILNRIDMSTINITTDEYRDYFQITYEEKWEINVIKNLDQSILNEKVDIIMELIATDKEVTGEIGEATLLITLPAVNNDEVPKFSSIFYESQCNSSTKILETSPIVITNKPDPSDITVAIQEDEYKSNFEIEYNSETNSWQVKVKSLPENEIGNDLVLTLTATETNNNNIGQAALVLNFPPLNPPEFNSIQYYGEYKIVEKSLTVDEVKIVNKQDQKNKIHLVLTDSDRDLSSTFEFSYNDDEDSWEITLNGTLDDGYINGKTQLVLTLTAEEDGNDLTGSATVIISLPTEDKDGNDLTFSELHYEGNYIVNDEPEVQLNRDIHLDSKQDLTNVVFMFNITEKLNANDYLTIEKMSTYGDYVVTVTKSLPADILQNQRSLAVTLHATLGKNEASTTLVINLPIPGEEDTIDFSKLLYNGDYSEIDGLAVEEISIITNENSKNIQVDISKDSPYYVYFKVTQSNKIVKLTADNIPSDIIKEISVISLTLTAQSSGTSKTGEAVVNINIRSYQGSAQFDSPLFNGKYEVKENIVTLTVEPITLTTDIEDDLISIAVDNAMVDYFDVSYTSSEVSLQLKKEFPEEFLSNSTIPVLLTGSIKKTDVKTQTVVNLRIITDTQPDNNNILRFDDVLFTAQYSLENGEGKFEQDGDIGLTTNLQADEIDVEISEDSIFGENFGISYANQKVIVHLEKDISTDDFYTNNIISLTMIATTLNNTISTSSVLNIRLNNNGASDNGYISFDKPVYNGNYIVENDLATINYDDITVDTDEEDDNVIASIEEPYDAYFKVTYADKTIKPVLKINQASSVLRDSTNIAVVFCVKIKDTNLVAKTVTNFQVIDKDDGEANDGSIYFPKPVYNGVYNANSDTFTEDDIIIITQHPDTDMEVKMSNEYQYEKYFSVELKNNQVNISLKEKLPKDVVDQLGYIALTIKVTLKSNQKIFAETVLNVEVRGKSRDSVGSNDQKYIIAVSVLSVVLFLVIIGVIAAYFFIFRKSKYEKMSEDEYISSKVKFDKSTLKRGSTDRSRSSALEERRPTGYVFEGNEPRESTTEGPDMERKKSVAFDERVEKMQIGEVNDDDIDKIPKQITEL
ncbi:uncharacterized protein LOC130903546 isoform X2 [Diorhabda carinulata]|uniref:uncharacterized protein LOC130903546 isoform X2 n=1 Tax=Diorhabda carinulata TaxID=1163345 RepID=UPI0025A0E1F0|nr:uncharacterized protein LOC130903546 isoform X2 [Diorhabda carinulata]